MGFIRITIGIPCLNFDELARACQVQYHTLRHDGTDGQRQEFEPLVQTSEDRGAWKCAGTHVFSSDARAPVMSAFVNIPT